MKIDLETLWYGFILLIIATLIFGGIGLGIYKNTATHRDETFVVKKTERIVEGNSSKYLIFTKDGVYENVDSLWNWKFDSSDVYNELEVGKTYTCDVVGWRVQFLSWYPNIISCEEVKN